MSGICLLVLGSGANSFPIEICRDPHRRSLLRLSLRSLSPLHLRSLHHTGTQFPIDLLQDDHRVTPHTPLCTVDQPCKARPFSNTGIHCTSDDQNSGVTSLDIMLKHHHGCYISMCET